MTGYFLTTIIFSWLPDPGKGPVKGIPIGQMPPIALKQSQFGGRFSYGGGSPERYLTGADLSNLPIHDEDVRAFLSNAPNVTWLNLGNTKITDACLTHLEGMSGLSDLTLQATAITDSGLVHLAQIQGLENLSLSGTGITDAGLEHLQSMTALRRLDLRNTSVTDAGLKYLYPLVNLEEIMLYDTQVSPAGLKHFPEQIPRL